MGNTKSFLFGAGVSLPSNMPSTEEITNKVLSGKNIYYHTSDCYISIKKDNKSERVNRIVKFLRRIKIEVDRFYNREVNYEDLFYIVSQIRDYNTEYDNPVVIPFIERIKPDLYDCLNEEKNEKEWNIHKLAKESTKYIIDVINLLLSGKVNKINQYSLVKEAVKDEKIDEINIFTLNHDTLLEKYLLKNNISFYDGFKEYNRSMDIWDSSLFEVKESDIKLLKLHGSINWYRFREEINNSFKDFIGKEKNIENRYEYNVEPLESRPILLAGTFNKLFEYNRNIYNDLQLYFNRLLSQTKRLVVSGYSFSDKGINNRIIDWMSSSNFNKIVLIDPYAYDTIKNARGAIKRNWKKWKDNNLVSIIPTSIDEVSWCDL